MMLTQNDFKLNRDIHVHVVPMSNLYTLRGNDLRTTGSHHKFPQSKTQFCAYRGKGPCKKSVYLYRMITKFCSVTCLDSCFSDESKMKMVEKHPIST